MIKIFYQRNNNNKLLINNTLDRFKVVSTISIAFKLIFFFYSPLNTITVFRDLRMIPKRRRASFTEDNQ